jgi:hypothetical protein
LRRCSIRPKSTSAHGPRASSRRCRCRLMLALSMFRI